MSRVRRIPVGPSAPYKPFYTVVIRRRYEPAKLDFHLPTIRLSKGFLRFMAVLALLFLIGASILFLRSHVSLTPLPPSIDNPPIYPGAQQVEAKPYESNFSGGCEDAKQITLRTNDTNDQVRAFYKDVLTKEGWHCFGDGVCMWSRTTLDGHVLDTYTFDVSFSGEPKDEVWLSTGRNCGF